MSVTIKNARVKKSHLRRKPTNASEIKSKYLGKSVDENILSKERVRESFRIAYSNHRKAIGG